MKVLLFEWLTGGGLWSDPAGLESASQLLKQGVAMVSAVARDLTGIAEVDLLVDSRLICSSRLPPKPNCELQAELRAELRAAKLRALCTSDC